ncbi:MAG: hypothetical protein WCL28_13550, partial [bacterium]
MQRFFYPGARIFGLMAALGCLLFLSASPIADIFANIVSFPLTKFEENRLVGTRELSSGLRITGVPRFRISFNFCVNDEKGYQNLFQTDDLNQGVRAELIGGKLAVIARVANGLSPAVVVLSTTLKARDCHNFQLGASHRGRLVASLDGARSSIDNIIMPLTSVKIGIGFDETRSFKGELTGVRVSVDRILDPKYISRLINGSALLILSWLFFVIIFYVRRAGIYLFQKNWKTKSVAGIETLLILATIVPCIVAFVFHFASRIFDHLEVGVHADIMYGVLQTAPKPKLELVGFILICGSSGLFVLMVYHWPMLRRFARSYSTPRIAILSFMLLFSALSLLPSSYFVKACFLVSGAISAVAWFLTSRHVQLISRLVVVFTRLIGRRKIGSKIKFFPSTFMFVSVASLTCAFVMLGIYLLFAAWWPIFIPPDYYELPIVFDTVRGQKLRFTSDLLECFTGYLSEQCPADGSQDYINSITNLYNWQVETGRLFFHHSYMLMPLKSYLAYGIESKVPFLYGFGNTFFSIAFSGGGTTVSAYLAAIPIVVIVSLLLIAVFVACCLRQIIIMPIAFLLGMTMYFNIEFVPAYLAASFNPSRYLGIALQFTHICLLTRGRLATWAYPPFIFMLSMIWNTEFAIIGGIAQSLILLSPNIAFSWRQRLYSLSLTLFAYFLFSRIGGGGYDIVQTNYLGFFNLGVPALDDDRIRELYIHLVIGLFCCLSMALLFEQKDRDARLAIAPALAMLFIKFVFNPAPPHLFAVLTFSAPFAMIFIPWTLAKNRYVLAVFFIASLAFSGTTSILSGLTFRSKAQDFRQSATANYVPQQWQALGETFIIPHPEAKILQRIASLRSKAPASDVRLVLSPFDHLIAIYAPAPAYCGH